LVAERLSSAGRHEHERVVAVKHVPDDGFLVSFEFVEAEMLFQLLG
jgi:hypothetical protein